MYGNLARVSSATFALDQLQGRMAPDRSMSQ
jgi:hypothetical protein